MNNAPNILLDGSSTLEGGVNASRPPSIIGGNQLAGGINTIVRGGFVTCRPGFKRRDLSFEDEADGDTFDTYHCQGAEIYKPMIGDPYLLLHVHGELFKVALSGDYLVQNITPSGARGSYLKPYAWFKQAEDYMLVQDGTEKPYIYDGTNARRASTWEAPNYECPVGKMMEYAHGRLVVARTREVVIGDIDGGPTELYQFTENATVAEGGSYRSPVPGNISAVRATASLDNGIGQGPLTLHTPYGVSTLRIDEPRSTWKDIKFVQSALLRNGGLAQASTQLVNGDIWFRALDGFRSLIWGVRDFSGWGNTPQSTEIRSFTDRDDQALLQYGSSILFRNRLISTIAPVRVGTGFYHQGMASIDFDPLSSLGGKAGPAWDGIWTGIKPVHLVAEQFPSGERAFAICRNSDGGIELWEITADEDFDNEDQPIEWVPTFKSYNFSSPRQLKRLEGAEVFVDSVRGRVSFNLEYRPDQYPCWLAWKQWSVCQTNRSCGTGECNATTEFQSGYLPRMMAGQPQDDNCGSRFVQLRNGYEFQPRITILGKAVVRGIALGATPQPQAPFESCPASVECGSVACCDNPFSFESTCGPGQPDAPTVKRKQLIRAVKFTVTTPSDLLDTRAHSYRIEYSLDDSTWLEFSEDRSYGEGVDVERTFDTDYESTYYFRVVPLASAPCAGTASDSVESEYVE